MLKKSTCTVVLVASSRRYRHFLLHLAFAALQVQVLVTSHQHLTHELRVLIGILRESSSPRSLAPAYQQEAVLVRPQSPAILSDHFPWPSAAAFACTGALAMLLAARLLKL